MRLFKSHIGLEKSDQSLIKAWKETRDQNIVSQLYSRYIELVYGLCLKYWKDEEKARDTVMEIYTHVSEKLLSHKVENFKSWLYSVSKNYCLEELRKKNTRRQKEIEAAVMYSEQVFHPDSEENSEQVKKLTECMDTLSDMQKDCIRRFYFEKQAYAAISEELNLEWNKVRSFIQNGRRKLKICMENKK